MLRTAVGRLTSLAVVCGKDRSRERIEAHRPAVRKGRGSGQGYALRVLHSNY